MSMAHNVAQLDLRDLISLAGLEDDIPQVVQTRPLTVGLGDGDMSIGAVRCAASPRSTAVAAACGAQASRSCAPCRNIE
jgi:hypothetical protein